MRPIRQALLGLLLLSSNAFALDFFYCENRLTGADGKVFTNEFIFSVGTFTYVDITAGPLQNQLVNYYVSPVYGQPAYKFQLRRFDEYNDPVAVMDKHSNAVEIEFEAGKDFVFNYNWEPYGKIHLSCEARTRT
ncbi:hypothetical protein K2X30_04780 [bacterium]|nr:hypothetical protein [bacterium]